MNARIEMAGLCGALGGRRVVGRPVGACAAAFLLGGSLWACGGANAPSGARVAPPSGAEGQEGLGGREAAPHRGTSEGDPDAAHRVGVPSHPGTGSTTPAPSDARSARTASPGARNEPNEARQDVGESVRPGVNDKYFEPGAAAVWARIFEGPDREAARERHAIVDALPLQRAMRVADLGAGTGLFIPLLAEAVGTRGRVYAVDIVPGFVKAIEGKVAALGLTNVRPILGTPTAPGLPEGSIDVAFLGNVYHHLEYPGAYLRAVRQALRPGGVLAVMDFERIEGVSRKWILEHVRAGKPEVTAEIAGAGFELIREQEGLLTENYLLLFRTSSRAQPSEREPRSRR